MHPENTSVPTPTEGRKGFIHWLRHLLRMAPCDLVQVIHESNCRGGEGFCGLYAGPKCETKLELKYRCCGETTYV